MKKDSTTDIFIKKALVLDKNSAYNGKKVDVLIKDGLIVEIGKEVKEVFGATKFDSAGLCISPGFADLHVNLQDPGYEYKEEIHTALDAASAGGFTGILSCSTTIPTIDGKSGVEYQLKNAKGKLTDLWASGSISKRQEGKELAEMYDMHKAGAKIFYDFKSEIEDSQLLKLALLYSKSFNGLIMIHPTERFLSSSGIVNEGIMSTRNGLQGMPAIAEEMGVQRALKLCAYTDRPIHFSSISTIESINLIKKAKKDRLKVTCGVCVANLFYNEEIVNQFDSNFKLNPPVRDEKTRKALIDALSKGIIDVVISDHWPQNIESKECEFEVAEFGMNSLETSFAMLRSATKEKIELEQLIDILSSNPRSILNIEVPTIEKGSMANLTLFNPNNTWSFDVKTSLSLSRNSSANSEFTGEVLGTINNNQVFSKYEN